MAAYEEYSRALLQAGTPADELQRIAHKLRGSAGTLGLCGISALAQEVEDACEEGAPVRAIAARLPAMIQDTRHQLAESGYLA